MKTRSRISILTSSLLALVASPLSAHAGGETGNGGGMHVCKADSPSTLKNRFYDLYELHRRYRKSGFTEDTSLSGMDRDSILQNRIQKIAQSSEKLAAAIQKELEYVRTHLQFDAQIELNRVQDADILMKDKGCEYVQLANWDDRTGLIFVDPTLQEKLASEVDHAAFLFHEAAYSAARKIADVKNSNGVREFVAQTFSGQPLSPRIFSEIVGALERKGYRDFYARTDSDDGSRYTSMGIHLNFSDPKCDDGAYFSITQTGPRPVQVRGTHTSGVRIELPNQVLGVEKFKVKSTDTRYMTELASTTCSESYVREYDSLHQTHSITFTYASFQSVLNARACKMLDCK